MEFRILGAPEVMHDGSPLAIRGRVAPRLLSVLMLEAGHPVPTSTLVDALWEQAPSTARRQVQNAVSVLRDILGDGVVAAVADGYRLAVPSEAVDAGRFTAEVGRARQLRKAGRPEPALRVLRDALALWRGHALAGLGGRVLETGARRLNESRVDAVEDRYDLELELGHRVAVGELRQLLAEHPYRQRLAAQLMLALYREGRAPEALEFHHRMRTRLIEHLGIEPGRPLQDRYAAILREDPALDAPKTASAPPVPSGFAPAQLPADLAGFTGRRPQLDALDALITERGESAALAAITGAGGSGKTALSVHWAYRNRAHFPDGQLYINLRGYGEDEPLTPRDALARLLPALGQPYDRIPSQLDAVAALYRTMLAERRILVLLDNARDAEQVEPLLPGGRGTVTLVTSRHRLTELTAIHDVRPVTLDALDGSQGLALLSKLVPESRLAAEPEPVRRLIDLCAGLPLALRIVGANLAGLPHSSIAEFTAGLAGPNRLKLLTVDGDPHATVATAIEQSFHALDPGARELFLLLGLIPGIDLPEALTQAVSGLSAPENRELLERLESSHLIERHGQHRFRFHDLVRLYARQHAESTLDATATEAVQTAVIDWYATAFRHSDGDDPGNLVATFRAWQDRPDAWRLARMLPEFIKYGHSLTQLRPHVETGLAKAKASGGPEAASRMYDALAQVHVEAGDELAALACGREAVAIARGMPGGDADGGLRSRLAALLLYNSHYEESAELSLEALSVAESNNDTERMFHDCVFLGAAKRSSGRFRDAETFFTWAGRLADDQGPDDPRRVTARFKLARLYNDMDRLHIAWSQLEWIETWWRRTGSDYLRARVLWLRGNLHRRSGDLEAAERDLAESWELSHAAGIGAWSRHARFAQIELCCARGDFEQGMAYVDELAEGGADDFERDDRAQWAVLRARVQSGFGHFRSAVDSARQARSVFENTNNPLRLAHCLIVLAEAHEGLAEADLAGACRDEARRLFNRLGLSEEHHVRTVSRA